MVFVCLQRFAAIRESIRSEAIAAIGTRNTGVGKGVPVIGPGLVDLGLCPDRPVGGEVIELHDEERGDVAGDRYAIGVGDLEEIIDAVEAEHRFAVDRVGHQQRIHVCRGLSGIIAFAGLILPGRDYVPSSGSDARIGFQPELQAIRDRERLCRSRNDPGRRQRTGEKTPLQGSVILHKVAFCIYFAVGRS